MLAKMKVMNRFDKENPSTLTKLFIGDFDYGLFMCMVNEGKDYLPSSDGDIEISSSLDDETKEMRPIDGIFGLENCYITKDGEIYQRIPTQKRDGIEVIRRNFSTYSVKDLTDKAFGVVESINPIKHNY